MEAQNIGPPKQELNNLDINNLTALSPEVISNQATINIGTIGHVAHGKSTVVKAISGVQTVRFKNELERNITIKLERLSKERLEAILKSPELLRDYEQRVEKTLKMRRSSLGVPKLWTQFLSQSNSLDSLNTLRSSSVLSTESSNSSRKPFNLLRKMSTSPSSGYESGSVYSLGTVSRTSKKTTTTTTKMRKRAISIDSVCSSSINIKNKNKSNSMKRRKSVSAATVNNQLIKAKTTQRDEDKQQSTSNPAKRIKAPKGEYIVEHIECVESVSGKAVFFVKWLGYPSYQNTWESLENLKDCAILEEFIEDRCTFFDVTIATISSELENEIQINGLNYDTKKLNIKQLDEFEPLHMKVDFLLLAQFRDARSRNQKEPEKIRKRLIEMMLMKPYYYQRKRQQIELQEWQTNVNKIEFLAPIKIENNFDLEIPDPNFEYILESFVGKSLNLNALDEQAELPPVGCECVDECAPSKKCCARNADSIFAYDKTGRLRISPGEAIYECNSKCICDKTCRNRVIQHGRKNALTIFKTPNGCGWGVRTERPLRKGEYVCEYVGEIISCDEANERGKRYDDIGRTYLFDLDYNTTSESIYTIDAALFGNISHFINHSCDPNLAVFPFWIDNLDVNMPRLAFFTLRPIKAGEELNFDYMRCSTGNESENVYENLSTAEKVPCRCGAQNCRGVLF